MKRFFNSALLIAVVATALTLTGCASVKPIEKQQLDCFWVLKTLNKKDAKTAFAGPLPTVEFDFANSIVFGRGGCNRYSGKFSLTNANEFSAPMLASTMMACMHENAEGEFLKALSTNKLKLSINKEGLLVLTEGNKIVLVFELGEESTESGGAQIVNDENLKGAWTLTTIADGDVATMFATNPVTMEFATEGKVFGNAGCNTYRTNYTLKEGSLTFSPAMSTKMACPSMEGESKFLKILATPLQATINGDRLILLQKGNIVLEFTKIAK